MVHTEFQKYDVVDHNHILNIWENLDDRFHVYVHSPFCPTICKFCIYNGIKGSKSEFNDYYYNYLPSVIDLYSPILEKKKDNLISWLFGGGTPSLMTPEIMRNVFERIPGFKNSLGEKTFELYPATWSVEQLDVLSEFNFNNVIICLQTFDRKTLIKQKRIPTSVDEIDKIVCELRKRNFNICVDIISFLNTEDDDYKILIEDLELVYTHIFPDEVSVQTLYQHKNFTYQTLKAVFESKFILENTYGVELFGVDHIDSNDIELLKKTILETNMSNKCFRLFKENKIQDYLNKKFCTFLPSMDPAYAHGFDGNKVHTMAIGSYKNEQTQTHSNIGKFNYIERNDDNKNIVFKFVSDSFYKESEFLYKILESIGEPPRDLVFSVMNDYVYEKEIPLHLSFSISHRLQGVNPAIDQYIEKFYSVLENEKQKIKHKLFDHKDTIVFMNNGRP